MELEKGNHHKIIIGAVGIGGAIIAIYLGATIFFVNRFYPGSTINCVNVSGKTVEEADDELFNQTKAYQLDIKGRNGFDDSIQANDIQLNYIDNKMIQKFKDSQNPFKWIYSAFGNTNYKNSNMFSFNDDNLKKKIDNLSCFNVNNIEESKNPILQYENGEYTIVKEVYGNKVDKEKLYKVISDAIENGNSAIDIDKNQCYENPRFTSESSQVVDAKDTLNKYVSSKITYNTGDKEEVLDGDDIRNFIDVDKDYNVSINEKKVNEYVTNTLCAEYNTVGTRRQFKTTYGNNISISGGDYGRKIDTSKEVQYLLDAITYGKTDTREPEYSQVPFCNGTNDIGNTYVEVSLSGQHLWFYKNGELVTEGSIVSGNVSNGCGTPGGVYKLDYKEKNATLKGEGYSTPVSFWMPFNGGIGIHDATWRGNFGGNIYLYGGSHGCVNAPYSLAQTIFSNIEAGTPIVCYY